MIRAMDDPLVAYAESGSVHLSYNGGEDWIVFRTVAHWNDAREHIDRLVVAHELDAWEQFHGDRESYFKKCAALRVELNELRGEAS